MILKHCHYISKLQQNSFGNV